MRYTLLACALLVSSLPAVAMADWSYRTSTDPMTSKEAKQADLDSVNSLALDFPYKGQNKGQLIVRKHPKFGLDVVFQIEKGQLMCNTYNGCPVNVRFDEKPPMKFSGTGPADNSSNTIFLRDANRFITEARKAKKILVQANVYQNGAPVLEFVSSKPLEWGGAAPAKSKP